LKSIPLKTAQNRQICLGGAGNLPAPVGNLPAGTMVGSTGQASRI
jgi:hypothetical protein